MTSANDEASNTIQERLTILSNLITRIGPSSADGSHPSTQSDRDHLANAKSLLEKFERNFSGKTLQHKKSVNTEDLAFADSLLELFTMSAFNDELADLSKGGDGQMTSDELATLAESIRTFALGIDTQDRHLFSSV